MLRMSPEAEVLLLTCIEVIVIGYVVDCVSAQQLLTSWAKKYHNFIQLHEGMSQIRSRSGDGDDITEHWMRRQGCTRAHEDVHYL